MKVFTMVKGENDIVEDWVLYHGHLFGFRNIYVIDNLSLDGTYESFETTFAPTEIGIQLLQFHIKTNIKNI